MSQQERWNLKHKQKCAKSQKKYMQKIYREAKMFRKLVKEGKVTND